MRKSVWAIVAAVGMVGAWAGAQEKEGGYEVHDMSRPQPVVVTPGEPSTQEKAGTAPSDAVVLFDGKDLSKWKGEKGDWTVKEGYFEVKPGSGSLVTKEQWGDVQVHVEWMEPEGIKGESQGRGNSGVFLMGRYEVQVLDVYNNKTYPDGTTGGLYGQYPPLANVARPQGQWQTYDIIFRTARVDDKGKVTTPARATVIWNGVVVQDNMDILGPTHHMTLAKYAENEPTKGPLSLQDHGNPVRFRNIWVRPLPAKPSAANRPNSGKH